MSDTKDGTVEVRVHATRTVRYSQVIEISKQDLAAYKQAARDDNYQAMHYAVEDYLNIMDADWDDLDDVVVERVKKPHAARLRTQEGEK